MRNIFVRPVSGIGFLLALILLSGCTPPPRIGLVYFYASHCNDCGEVEERLSEMNDRLRRNGAEFRVSVTLHNIMTEGGFEAFEAALANHDVGLSSRHAPLLLAGSAWFYGEDIETTLAELESGRLPSGSRLAPEPPR